MNMKKRLGALALALTMALSLSIPAAAEELTVDSAQSVFSTAMAYGGAVVGSYAVWQDGKIIDSGTSGAILESAGAPAGLEDRDLYGIGSVSKTYVAAAVMKLVEAGKIRLDAPVTTYLKDFKMADPRYTKITVRMLLNHTSGLMGTSQQNAFLFGDDDRQATEELLERLSTQRLKADPGEFAAYCNDGFTLAELVVEAVSGRNFMDYVRSVILNPLGLKNTYAPQDDFNTGLLAPTYNGSDLSRELPPDTMGLVGTGGIYATAADLAAFGGALTGTNILSAASTAAMAAPEYERGIWPDEPLGMVSFGLGWDAVEFWPFAQNGIQCLVKGGDTLRYHAALMVLPEYNLAAAVLTSGGVSVYNELAATQLLAEALEAKGVELDLTIPTLPEASPAAMPAALVNASGYYGASAQQVQVTVSADGKMVIHQVNLAEIPDQTLSYYSDGSFRDEGNSVAVKLVEESNGATYLYQQNCSAVPGFGVMLTSDYLMVKMPENKISPELQAMWDELGRAAMMPLEEKYTSQVYLSLSEQSTSAGSYSYENVPGYIQGCRIIDETTARYELPIGRDVSDILITSPTAVTIAGMDYTLLDGVKNLYTGSGHSYATILEDGYARWFKTGPAAGRTMTVTLPENAGFYVYDANAQLTASSLLWDDSTVTLPKDGYVVFIGDAGTRFHLKFSA